MSHFLLTCLSILLIFGFSESVWAAQSYDSEELTSGYITVIDETDTPILQTGLTIHVGDQYINEDDKLYEIITVEDTQARARYISQQATISLEKLALPVQGAAGPSSPIIAIYHTHTDESYTPSDGKASIAGKGTIMLVGDALGKRLTELGYQVQHNKTLHDPHDANAYQRSRRTFMKLLALQPATLFDIHRDSAPLTMYKTTINGRDAAKILLVVGQQNQNRQTTQEYAKTIKSKIDAKYKGLVRGIFIARGNYNQDLNPRSMLVEIGTEYNTREAAQYSAALFADVVPSFIAINPDSITGTPATPDTPKSSTTPIIPGTPTPASGQNNIAEEGKATKIYGTDIVFIIGALVIGIIVYLYLSTGSWGEAKRKLNKFYKYEFTNFFGPRKKDKK